MTREEAILRLEALKDFSQNNELKNMHEAIDMAIHSLEADVRENVEGEWKILDKHTVQCPVCNNTLDLSGVNAGRGDANYCPNCGADMRGEVK